MDEEKDSRSDGIENSPAKRSWLWVILPLSAGAAVIAPVAWFYATVFIPHSGPGTATTISIESGTSAHKIGRLLQQHDVISSAWIFRQYVRLTPGRGILKAGEYRFEGPAAMAAVAEKLRRADIVYHPVTVPEGLTMVDIAAIFEERGFASNLDLIEQMRRTELISDVDPAATDLEGYLFPETYFLTRGIEAEDLVSRMVQEFRAVWTHEIQSRAQELGMTVRDIVTLASLVEKETAHPEERKLVSSVFHNRLARGIKLECDPTVIYAVNLVKPFDGILHRSDLQIDSPYNTYLYAGLPPGPIASPGRDSILAALYPVETNYLYFVSRNDGSHVFSSSYREHAQAVRKYQRR